MNSNSKRVIAFAAALQILLYHCWIPVFSYGTALGAVERFLVASTYCGVDIFFFISAYSLVSRPVEDYKAFLVKRAVKLLPLFIIALIFGHFLWFIPAIMIMYIVLPPMYRVCKKRPGISFALLFIGWAVLVYLVLGVLRPTQDFGIFLFRIPSIILGAYATGFLNRLSRSNSLLLGSVMSVVGLVLIYNFGYLERLNFPYRGTFYLTGIPLMLGMVLILNPLAANREHRVIGYLGSITLELYFAQMVLGTPLVRLFYSLTGSRIFTNIAVIAAVAVIAALIKAARDMIMRLIR